MREPEFAGADVARLGQDRRRLGMLLVSLPIMILAMAWVGAQLSGPASRLNPTVSLAEELARNPVSTSVEKPTAPNELALERARLAPAEITEQAARIGRTFAIGGWAFGGWVGLVIGVKLISLSLRRTRTDYEPDRGNCVACARCFEHCPNELARIGKGPAPGLKACQSLAEEVAA